MLDEELYDATDADLFLVAKGLEPSGELVGAPGEVGDPLCGHQPGLGDEVLGGDGAVAARAGPEPDQQAPGQGLVEEAPGVRVTDAGTFDEVDLGCQPFTPLDP